MQIDVLSPNTLKLTLTKIDMSDLDIKYESLSARNPETKRLLAHVLKNIQHDSQPGFSLTGERLFVEAFPRADGGCMLYISCLENSAPAQEPAAKPRKPRRNYSAVTARQGVFTDETRTETFDFSALRGITPGIESNSIDLRDNYVTLVGEADSIENIGRMCRCLTLIQDFSGALYEKDGVFRILVTVEQFYARKTDAMLREYLRIPGGCREADRTAEYYNLVSENAGELLAQLVL